MVPSENPEDPDKTNSSWMNGHMYQIDLYMYVVYEYSLICTYSYVCMTLYVYVIPFVYGDRSTQTHKHAYTYKERKRERYTNICAYIYIYIYVSIRGPSRGSWGPMGRSGAHWDP